MNETVLALAKQLQTIRGVPTYLFFGSIYPHNVIKTRRILLEDLPSGDEVDVILHSSGGDPSDAYRLVRALRNSYKTVNIIVPFWAKSAATLFAFGGNRIVMQSLAELGPLDVQIKQDREDATPKGWESALNVQSSLEKIEERSQSAMLQLFLRLEEREDVKINRQKLAEMTLGYSEKFYAPLLEKIDTYEIGKMARLLEIGKMYAVRILREYGEVDPQDVGDLLDFLVYECPEHGYVIDLPLISQYLPNAISSVDDPYGDEYNKQLGKLAVLLMERDSSHGELVGFVNTLIPKKGDSAVRAAIAKQSAPAKGASNRSSSKPQTHRVAKKPAKP